MTIVEAARAVTGGVDTHLDIHVAAALDGVGALLGTAAFPTTAAGYQALLRWLESHGEVTKVGVEGTGSDECRDPVAPVDGVASSSPGCTHGLQGASWRSEFGRVRRR